VPVSSVDLDCADVGARNFQVVGTDVHRFDGDHDGIACE
jgi:micrococcal nuclease